MKMMRRQERVKFELLGVTTARWKIKPLLEDKIRDKIDDDPWISFGFEFRGIASLVSCLCYTGTVRKNFDLS